MIFSGINGLSSWTNRVSVADGPEYGKVGDPQAG
jgi:hypothetical protein